MVTPLEPAEQALLEYALARGFLTQAQVDEALALLAAAAARGLPMRLLQILRERYLDPSSLPELAAVYESQQRPPGDGADSVTLVADGEDSVTLVAAGPPPQPPPAPAPVGPRQIGPYEVVREIARGGMGVVYVARRSGEEEELALKLLLNSDQAEAKDVERFKIEAAAAGKLSHPNIVKIHDVGQDARGCHYMVMDYVDGGSLQGLLRRQGPMDERQAAGMTIKLARALQHAHDQRVLHRDMKPANVLVRDGEPLIADFGLAKQQGASGKSLTVTGEVMGTPAYMPPEQAEGARKEIGARSDQYSLGATLYEMLTGLPPFQGQSPINVVMAVLTKPPMAPRKRRPELDAGLEAIVLKTLSKEREERYPDCEALAQALEGWLGEGGSGARSKGVLAALATVALLAIGAAVAFAAGSAKESPPATVAAVEKTSPPNVAESARPQSAGSPAETPSESPVGEEPSSSLDVTRPSPEPAPSLSPPMPFDEGKLERVVLLDADSLSDSSLEHLEVGQPWLVTRTAEGLLFRGNRNASPRLRLPLRSAGVSNRPFMLRVKFRVASLGRELQFGVNLCSQIRGSPRLLALAMAMASKAQNTDLFRGFRLRYYPKSVLPSPKRLELFSPEREGFRPTEELTLEVRASEGELEMTTLVGDRVLGRTRGRRVGLDSFQAQDLDLEVGFIQSNSLHGRRPKGFSRQLNRGEALLISCELLAEPGTFVLAPAHERQNPWRLLGRAGRTLLARRDPARVSQLLSDPLLSGSAGQERMVRARTSMLRALAALRRGERESAIQELRQLDALEQEQFPRFGSRTPDNEKAFMKRMGSSFWGLRTADLPLVESDVRGLFVDAYRAHVLHPETDSKAFADAQGLFFELDAGTLSGLDEAYQAARAKDMAPLARLIRDRVAKTLRREDRWGLRQYAGSWFALSLSAAEPPAGLASDPVAGYLWELAGAPALAWKLLEPSVKSEDPFQRWVAVNFGASALYRQGDYAGAHKLWKAIAVEALEGPLRLVDADGVVGAVDTGVHDSMVASFEHADRMIGSR